MPTAVPVSSMIASFPAALSGVVLRSDVPVNKIGADSRRDVH